MFKCLPEKIAYISWRNNWFPCEITSDKRAQKFHTDDASLLLGIASDWLKQICPHGTTNQKLYSDLGSDASSVWNFCGRDSHRRHFMGKPMVVSQNVGCFLRLQSNPAISNLVNSKSPLFRRKIEFPWIYPYVFSHLLSAISNSVISNSPLFRTHRSFPTP